MHDAQDINGDLVKAGDVQKELLAKGEEWLAERRIEGFWCLGCGTQVYFVRTGLGPRGRLAHFKISPKTPHTEDSCESSETASRPSPDGPVDVDVRQGILNVGGGVIAIRYEKQPSGSSGAGGGGGMLGSGSQGRTGAKYISGGGSPNTQETKGLKAYLKGLRASADYLVPGERVYVENRGEVPAVDYFCRFEDATDQHAAALDNGKSRLMAYWGVITDPRMSGNLFLNGTGMAVMLPKPVAALLLAGAGLSDHSELKDWHVIAEGRLSMGWGGSRYVRVDDQSRVAVLKPKIP